jgi:hypothetical protein
MASRETKQLATTGNKAELGNARYSARSDKSLLHSAFKLDDVTQWLAQGLKQTDTSEQWFSNHFGV